MNALGQSKRDGFTLIELLLTMMLTILLGILVTQATTATMKVTRLSNRSIDAASQARLALDCIGTDLSAVFRRRDVDFFAQNPGGAAENTLYFLSGVASSSASVSGSDNRGISMVAYRIASHTNNANRLCLERACIPIPRARPSSWAASSFMGLKSDGQPVKIDGSDTSFPTALIPATADFDLLSPGVVRMVVGFQLYPDNQPVTLKDGTTEANSRGQIVYSPPIYYPTLTSGSTSTIAYLDINRISSIVVGVVAIDLDSLRLLNASQVETLASHFPALSMNTLPVSAWKTASDTAASTGIPLPAAQAVRVFQRFYPITSYGNSPQ